MSTAALLSSVCVRGSVRLQSRKRDRRAIRTLSVGSRCSDEHQLICMAVKLLIFYSIKLLIYSTCRRGCSNFLEIYCQKYASPEKAFSFFCLSIAIFPTVRGNMCLKDCKKKTRLFRARRVRDPRPEKPFFFLLLFIYVFCSSRIYVDLGRKNSGDAWERTVSSGWTCSCCSGGIAAAVSSVDASRSSASTVESAQ